MDFGQKIGHCCTSGMERERERVREGGLEGGREGEGNSV